MGRKRVNVDDLVGATEIAHRADVKLDTVDKWRRRPMEVPFPEPVVRLAAGDVWSWPDVQKWLQQTGRV